MAYNKKYKKNGDFVSVTGIWRPKDRDAKHLGSGIVKREVLEDLLEAIDEKGGDAASFYLMKNDYAESSSDPKYKISALPLGARDDDEHPRRKKRYDDDEEDERPARRKKSRPRDDDFDDEEDDEEEEEEQPRRRRNTAPKRRTGKRAYEDLVSEEEVPF